MRWRIGLLQDAAAIERQIAKDHAAEAKKHKSSIPTVKTEAQAKADEEAAEKASKESSEPPKPRPKPKIRPLSEAKAIETGANFISETFLFSVAAGLILFESWRSNRKAKQRRDDVAERISDLEESEKAAREALVELEKEVIQLRSHHKNGKSDPNARILPRAIYEVEEEAPEQPAGWFARVTSFGRRTATQESSEVSEPGPAEKILKKSDEALEKKHKQQEAEDAAAKAGTSTP
jgi:optic atrophy 3 protein